VAAALRINARYHRRVAAESSARKRQLSRRDEPEPRKSAIQSLQESSGFGAVVEGEFHLTKEVAKLKTTKGRAKKPDHDQSTNHQPKGNRLMQRCECFHVRVLSNECESYARRIAEPTLLSRSPPCQRIPSVPADIICAFGRADQARHDCGF
jgi:hypothetical protein